MYETAAKLRGYLERAYREENLSELRKVARSMYNRGMRVDNVTFHKVRRLDPTIKMQRKVTRNTQRKRVGW